MRNNNNIVLSCLITNNNKRKRNVARSCLVTKAKVSNTVLTKILMVSILILVTTIIIIPYNVTVAFTPTSIIPKLSQQQQYTTTTTATQLYNSKPSRLVENVDGVVYVNDKCIDCAACKGFASQIFRSNHIDTAHIVYQQPQTVHDIVMTRAALAACPVAAIRIESYAERNHKTSIHNKNIQMNDDRQMTAGTVQVANDIIQDVAWSEQDSWIVQQMTSKEMKRPFPRPFLFNETIETSTINHLHDFKTVVSDVYWTGHHNEHSFGAIPYLVKAYYNNTDVWIMIDVPKFNTQSVRDITSLTGPNGPHYLFMTHVDDTADHELWANYFNSTSSGYCQRIFHSGDLGRYNWIGDTTLEHVPILLQSSSMPTNSNSLTAYTLDGTMLNDDNWIEQFENGSLNTDVIILHTPGHSPGSCTLYKRRRTIKPNENDSKTIPGVLFTGDTYAYTGTKMSGFPRYGRDMVQQNHTLSSLVMQLQQWDIIAPGHGLPRDYRNVPNAIRITELEQAQRDLFEHRR